MSEAYLLSVILGVIALVIILLNYSNNKKNKRIKDQYLFYFSTIKPETGIEGGDLVQLVHQFIVLDEVTRKLLVIDRTEKTFTHTLYEQGEIKIANLKSIAQPVNSGPGSSEQITTQSGINIISKDSVGRDTFIVFYDHAHQNVSVRVEMENKARAFLKKIKESLL